MIVHVTPSSDRRGVSPCPPRLPPVVPSTAGGNRRGPPLGCVGAGPLQPGRIAAPGYWRPVLSNGLRGASAHGLGPEARRGRQRPPQLDRLEVLYRRGISRAAGRPRDAARRRPPGDRSCRTASRRRVTASATQRWPRPGRWRHRFATKGLASLVRGRTIPTAKFGWPVAIARERRGRSLRVAAHSGVRMDARTRERGPRFV